MNGMVFNAEHRGRRDNAEKSENTFSPGLLLALGVSSLKEDSSKCPVSIVVAPASGADGDRSGGAGVA
jgi:hypothetical protein